MAHVFKIVDQDYSPRKVINPKLNKPNEIIILGQGIKRQGIRIQRQRIQWQRIQWQRVQGQGIGVQAKGIGVQGNYILNKHQEQRNENNQNPLTYQHPQNHKANPPIGRAIKMTESIIVPRQETVIRRLTISKDGIRYIPERDVIDAINKATMKDLLAIAKNEEVLKHKYVKDAIEKRARGGITGKLSPGFIGIFSSKSKEEARKKQEILDLLQGKDKEKIIKQLIDDQHEHTDKYKKDVLSIINKASTKELLALVDNEAVLKHEYVRNAIEKKAKEGITGKLSPGLIGVFKSAYEEKAIQKREILKKIEDSKNRVNQEVIGKNETPDPHSNKIDPKKQYTDTPQKVENTAASLENSLKMQQSNLMRSSSNQGLQNKDPLKEKTGQSL